MKEIEFFKSDKLRATENDVGVTTVYFCNPEKLNAFDLEMTEQAEKLHTELFKRKPRVVVFRGESRAFSAGGDLDLLLWLTEQEKSQSPKIMRRIYDAFLNLAKIDCPTIAMLNGPAIGAGFCFALACDMRYTFHENKIGLNFARIGLAPGMAAEYFGLKAMSRGKLTEMIATGHIYVAWELANHSIFEGLFPVEKLEERVYEIASQIATNSKKAIAFSLQQIRNPSGDLAASLDRQAESQAECFISGEMAEAIAAQREKRKFRFSV